MAKLVDAPASGAGDRKVVGVRVPSWAPFLTLNPPKALVLAINSARTTHENSTMTVILTKLI